MQTTTFDTYTSARTNIRVMAANQNSVEAVGPGISYAPQWYDVKLLAEHMFDMRAKVRDAIYNRKAEDLVKPEYTASVRPIRTDGLYGSNMEIAISWHSYRRATAQYHRAWRAYMNNLQSF